jgi:GDPmannose 4,6-dehydratase
MANSRFKLHYGDLSDSLNITRLVSDIRPDEIYNLAAQSHVAVSFENPEYTADVDALGALRLLEAMRIAGLSKSCKYYQASTSELYGLVHETPQKETTPFHPRSPYAVAKLYAYWITVNYREAYGMFAVNGILFNHESPRRGETFVTRKITMGLAAIVCGVSDTLYLGNIDSLRDWGHAKDYVEMQWLMLQNETPKDYVIASGQQYTVREFIIWTAHNMGFEIKFQNSGLNEVGVVCSVHNNAPTNLKIGMEIIKIDPKYYRPAEVETLLGDASLARKELGWEPKISAQQMCAEMSQEDLNSCIKSLR